MIFKRKFPTGLVKGGFSRSLPSRPSGSSGNGLRNYPPPALARSDPLASTIVLSLFFRAALGIERIFHFETLDDPGFAILSGGKKVLSRSWLGGLVRAVTTEAVKKLTHATESWGALRHRRS